MRAASPLIAALRRRGPSLVLSTTSPSGRDVARGLAGEGGTARLLPLDLVPLVRRAVRAAMPRALVVVETEIWPALLHEVRRADVPALLVSARISDRSFPRYRRVVRWIGPVLESFAAIQAQSGEDAERLVDLGAPPGRVEVGGNLKFDVPEPDPSTPPATAVRRARAGGWSVLVAGSTHPGEEETVLEAVRRLRAEGKRLALVLAPRHLERRGDVEAILRREGHPVARWSELGPPLEAGVIAAFETGAVVLVDVYGVLGQIYGGADCAFVGGSLVPVGGHSLLEPLSWGVPVLFGPHMQNAVEIRDEVLARGLGVEVGGAEDLVTAAAALLGSPAEGQTVRREARALFEANRGAVGKVLRSLESLGALGDA